MPLDRLLLTAAADCCCCCYAYLALGRQNPGFFQRLLPDPCQHRLHLCRHTEGGARVNKGGRREGEEGISFRLERRGLHMGRESDSVWSQGRRRGGQMRLTDVAQGGEAGARRQGYAAPSPQPRGSHS